MKNWIAAHKLGSGLMVIGVVFLGYTVYKNLNDSEETRYVVTQAQIGNIASSVSGTGYVSSENQIDVKSKVSGEVTRLYVKAGDRVTQGQLLAEIDSRDARLALENQKVIYNKLVKPADSEDLAMAEDNVTKSYSDAWNAISGAFLSLPNVIPGLEDIILKTNGYLNEQNLRLFDNLAVDYSNIAGISFYKANNLYEEAIKKYKNLNRSSSRGEIDTLLRETYDLVKQTADALKNTRNAINYVSKQFPDYASVSFVSTSSNINTWSNEMNSSLSSLLSAANSIATNQKILNDLKKGADALDVQSAALALEAKQNTYNDYFIRAPHAGVIAKVDVRIGSSASGAVIATIVSNRKFAEIPLNEIDAALVKVGNRTLLTFDAVPGLSIEGLVEEADLVGTIDQGVVTYNIKISFESDQRIRSGMSASTDIVTNEKKGVLVVPISAVKTRGSEHYVEIFDPPLSGNGERVTLGLTSPNSPVQKKVEVGISDDTLVEILSGLNDGEQVVVRIINTSASATPSSAPTIFGGGGGASGNVRFNTGGAGR